MGFSWNNPERKEAVNKFWALRNEGYTGPIDHNGDKVEDLDQWIEDHS